MHRCPSSALKLVLHSMNLRGSPEKTDGSGAGSLVRAIVSCKTCSSKISSLTLFVLCYCFDVAVHLFSLSFCFQLTSLSTILGASPNSTSFLAFSLALITWRSCWSSSQVVVIVQHLLPVCLGSYWATCSALLAVILCYSVGHFDGWLQTEDLEVEALNIDRAYSVKCYVQSCIFCIAIKVI